jgi:hypothetical protein
MLKGMDYPELEVRALFEHSQIHLSVVGLRFFLSSFFRAVFSEMGAVAWIPTGAGHDAVEMPLRQQRLGALP